MIMWKHLLKVLFPNGGSARRDRVRRPGRRTVTPTLEWLENRTLMAGNLAVSSVYIGDNAGTAFALPLPVGLVDATPTVGWSAEDMPAGSTFKVRLKYDGVFRDSAPITVSGTASDKAQFFGLSWYTITLGAHTLTGELIPFSAFTETTTADNAQTLSFTPVTFQSDFNSETQFSPPLAGDSGVNWWINNYYDLDQRLGTMIDWNGGQETYDNHNGLDIDVGGFGAMVTGVPVYAAASGVVVARDDGHFDGNTEKCPDDDPSTPQIDCSRDGTFFGNFITIDHGNGWQTNYVHLRTNSVAVSIGDVVLTGDLLGLVGSSGNSTRPHLHFHITHNGHLVEPYVAPSTYLVSPVPYSEGVDPELTYSTENYFITENAGAVSVT
jgi:murein DD-endopeptidase MepM/ murein hydrolase activator NlpD